MRGVKVQISHRRKEGGLPANLHNAKLRDDLFTDHHKIMKKTSIQRLKSVPLNKCIVIHKIKENRKRHVCINVNQEYIPVTTAPQTVRKLVMCHQTAVRKEYIQSSKYIWQRASTMSN